MTPSIAAPADSLRGQAPPAVRGAAYEKRVPAYMRVSNSPAEGGSVPADMTLSKAKFSGGLVCSAEQRSGLGVTVFFERRKIEKFASGYVVLQNRIR